MSRGCSFGCIHPRAPAFCSHRAHPSSSPLGQVLRQYLNKYFVTVIGLYLVARPVRLGLNGMGDCSSDMIAQYFTSTWKNMEAMSTSIQDLFQLTSRVGRSCLPQSV